METQFKKEVAFNGYTLDAPGTKGIDNMLQSVPGDNVIAPFKKMNLLNHNFHHDIQHDLIDLLTKLTEAFIGKTSFLVIKQNKYITVATENIAYFQVKNESSMIVCFNHQEYFVNHSLDHIQNLLAKRQFFRLNRQYLINFKAIKEVEHYFARKLLVNLHVPVRDKLLVSKLKVSDFLGWLENR